MAHYDTVIIGGGSAGLSAAIRLREKGVRNILILERENHLGGILHQCIHDGFGLTRFGESLSGPEYAQRLIDRAEELGIEARTGCTVFSVTPEKVITAVSRSGGLQRFEAETVLLTMGCRERTRGALAIPGTRPAGVYTAGTAQNYINIQNLMIGRNAVILGSGDIGLIMARRLTLEGAKVLGVYEVLPVPSGLPRNIQQCLTDYDIPLHLSHTVVEICGKERVTGVVVAQVDEMMRPIPGTEEEIPCDTLILSVGLIPENELSVDAGIEIDPRTRGAVVDEACQTCVRGIFAAGNVLHVHDLVDYVSLEAEDAAEGIASYLAGTLTECGAEVRVGKDIGHALPHRISGEKDFILSLRTSRPLTDTVITGTQNGREIFRMRRHKLLPAEMLRIPVKAASLEAGAALEVNVL